MKHLLYLLLALLPLKAAADIIPSTRLYPWSTNYLGLPGGIPTVSTIFCNITNSIPGTNIVAVGDGVVNDTAALVAALSLCPSGQVVYLPTGTTYSNTANLNVRAGRVLRGGTVSGTNWTTRINGGQITIDRNPSARRFVPLAGGSSAVVPTGATALEFSPVSLSPSTSTTLLPSVGSIITIAVTNDNTLIDPRGYEGNWANVDVQLADKNLAQMVEVTSITLTNSTNYHITFTPPSGWNWSNSLGVVIRIADVVKYAGVENIWLDSPSRTTASRITINNAAYCWLKNVRTTWSYNDTVYLRRSFRSEVRDSIFEHTQYTTPGGGYGVRMDLTPSFNLIENNIFAGLRASIIMSGGFGNAVTYNYIPWQTNYNNVAQKAIGFHASSPAFFLVEGNKSAVIGADDVHGSSIYSTFFRNNAWAYNPQGNATTGFSTTYNWACPLERKNLYYNFVGNVFGAPSIVGVNEASYLFNGGSRSASTSYIWSLGYPNAGAGNTNCQTGSGGLSYCYDTNTVSTVLRHGNFNYLLGTTESYTNNVSNPASPIPDSLLYTAKPSWYGTNVWPSIGPDLVGNMTNTIPAETRYLGGEEPPPTPPDTNPGGSVGGNVRLRGAVNLRVITP